MKVIEHGYDQLELRPRVWLFLLPFGLTFFIAGLVMFFTLGQTTELTCIREGTHPPQCHIVKTLLDKDMSDELIEGLHGAYIASSTDSDGDTTYRVVLQTSAGDAPLNKVWSSGYSKKQNIVTQIEAFLDNPNDEELIVEQSGSTGYLMGGIFGLIGLGVAFAATQMMFTAWYFDRTTMTVTHHRQNILGNRNTEWGLNEFTEAIVVGQRDSDGDRTYRIELITTMNEHIPLTSYTSSGYRKKAEVAERINHFLQG